MTRWLYQGLVQPVGPLQPPPAAPPFGWFQPANTVPPKPKQRFHDPGGFAPRPIAAVVTASFGWYRPANDPPRRRPREQPAPVAFVPFVVAPSVVTFGWYVPANEVVRSRRRRQWDPLGEVPQPAPLPPPPPPPTPQYTPAETLIVPRVTWVLRPQSFVSVTLAPAVRATLKAPAVKMVVLAPRMPGDLPGGVRIS